MSEPVLYILVRTDMASMNDYAGKVAAQSCHAANMLSKHFYITNDNKELFELFQEWEADRGFGTTIVLDGGSEEEIRRIVEIHDSGRLHAYSGLVVDPTYPIVDGNVTHLLSITTCGFIFVDREHLIEESELARLPLLDGNIWPNDVGPDEKEFRTYW